MNGTPFFDSQPDITTAEGPCLECGNWVCEHDSATLFVDAAEKYHLMHRWCAKKDSPFPISEVISRLCGSAGTVTQA